MKKIVMVAIGIFLFPTLFIPFGETSTSKEVENAINAPTLLLTENTNEEEILLKGFATNTIPDQESLEIRQISLIRLISPLPASIYIGDHRIPVPPQLCPQLWNKTLIFFSLRGITIKVAAIDYETGIDRVEFYVDNEMEPRDVEIKEYPEQYVFAWCWGETMFREEHVVKVVAYDKANNSATLDINIEVFLTIHLPPIW